MDKSTEHLYITPTGAAQPMPEKVRSPAVIGLELWRLLLNVRLSTRRPCSITLIGLKLCLSC